MGIGVLGRRIEQFIKAIESGVVILNQDDPTLKELVVDLEKVKRFSDGDIDIASCTPLVRQMSRLFVNATDTLSKIDPQTPPETPENITPKQVEEAQREYFRLLDDFFQTATGTPASRFEEKITFGDKIRTEAAIIAPRFEKAMKSHVPKLMEFYGNHGRKLLGAGKLYSGVNAVIGGASNFPDSAFNGYRKMALYADTVFVPDPVLPWIENDREHEGFKLVRMLQACHDILKLRPLADAKLPYPAVIVFPSWEKSLEANDEVTKDGIGNLVLSFFNHFLDAHFDDESEVIDYVLGDGKANFRRAVNCYGLLVPPGSNGPMNVDDGVKTYLEYVQKFRTPTAFQTLLSQPPESVAWLLIMERLAPQFHIRDNAIAMNAQPLLWNPAHFHYFNLCATATNQLLEKDRIIDNKTVTLLAALNQPSLAWLGNVGMSDLVRLREANANEKFRRSLADQLKGLNNVDETNMNRVAADVARGIAALLAEHSREADKLWFDYKKKLVLGGGIVLTGGVALSPWLAGLLGFVPGLAGLAGGAGTALKDYVHYRMDKHSLSKSVIGILSHAKREGT